MKLCIAGSRSINDILVVSRAVDTVVVVEHVEPSEVVSGGARGVDQLGIIWAQLKGIETKVFYPDWVLFGKYAGIRRNQEMARYLAKDHGILVSVWDRESKGTLHMMQYTHNLGVPVFVFDKLGERITDDAEWIDAR